MNLILGNDLAKSYLDSHFFHHQRDRNVLSILKFYSDFFFKEHIILTDRNNFFFNSLQNFMFLNFHDKCKY